jgi:hypothetical protein
MKNQSNISSHEPHGASPQDPGHPRRARRARRLMSKHRLGVAVGLSIPALGLGVAACGGASGATAATATTAAKSAPAAGSSGFAGYKGGGGGSNARSTNAAGGSVGKVSGVSSSSFTVSTPTGGKVTVKEISSTVYENGTSTSTASAVTTGKTVLVLGKVDGTTITASQVTVGPAINLSKAASKVSSFKQGTQSASKSVGQVPTSYKEGSGTIVSGTTATKATQAALKDYAGGVVDRVVRLSNGEYEVHNIGVNWPHHVFVNRDFQVVGAD